MQQIAQAGVVEQRLPRSDQRGRAASNAQPGVGNHLNLRLSHGNAGDQALRVEFGRRQRRAACAVGGAGSNHDGVGRNQFFNARHAVPGHIAVFFVQDEIGEFNRLQRPFAPVFFRVLLRMRMLDGKAVWRCGIEGCAFGGAQIGGKNRGLAGGSGSRADAVLQIDRVVLQVMNAGAGALVGVHHRAAVFQAPFARCANGAVNAARAARRAGDDARAGRVEGGRQLQQHRDVLAAGAVIRVSNVFGAGNLAFASGDNAFGIDVWAVQATVAAGGRNIEQRPVVVKNGEFSQLGRRRVQGIGCNG